MFRLAAVVALCVLPGAVLAQVRTQPPASPALPPIGLPLPPIGLPLPSLGLPLPALGLPPASDSGRRDGASSRGRNGDLGGRDRSRGHRAPAILYFAAPYLPYYAPAEQAPLPGLSASPPEPRPSQPQTGRVRLDVEPRDDLQVYVDGVFSGTLADVGAELELRAGIRRLEMRAPGHDPLVLEANVVADRTITYRGRLTLARDQRPQDAAPSPGPATAKPTIPARPQTFYLIPGCYMGNIPPQEVKLPAGCDLSRVITYTP